MQTNDGLDNQMEEEAEEVTSSRGNSSEAAEDNGGGLHRIGITEFLDQERVTDERRQNEEETDYGNPGEGSRQEPTKGIRSHILDIVQMLKLIKDQLYEAGAELFKKMKEVPETLEEIKAMEQEFGRDVDIFTTNNNNIELLITTVIRSCSFTESDRIRMMKLKVQILLMLTQWRWDSISKKLMIWQVK